MIVFSLRKILSYAHNAHVKFFINRNNKFMMRNYAIFNAL